MSVWEKQDKLQTGSDGDGGGGRVSDVGGKDGRGEKEKQMVVKWRREMVSLQQPTRPTTVQPPHHTPHSLGADARKGREGDS